MMVGSNVIFYLLQKKHIILVFLILFSSAFAQQSDLDELLVLDITQLMKMEVVTASKRAQTLSEVPAMVRVITAKQIQERGYLVLEDVFQDLPGFQFRNINGFNSYSFLRGTPSQNNLLLVMVDGVQLNELNSGGFYGGAHYNLANVKRIEVVYGPSSSLYGTNAVSGIINLITNDPQDAQGLSMNAAAGSFSTLNGDVLFATYNPRTKSGFVISGAFKHSDKAELGGAHGDYNWSDDMENFEKDLALDGKIQYNNFKYSFIFQDKQASRTTNYKSLDTDYLDYGTNWHIHFLNHVLDHVYEKNKNWSAHSRLYYRNSTVMDNTIAYIRDAENQGQVGYYRPNDLLGFEEQIDYHLKETVNIIGGMVLERENLAEGFSKTFSNDIALKPEEPQKPKMLTNQLFSFYLQSQIHFGKYIEMTLGIRHDRSDYYGNVWTPRLGMVYSQKKYSAKVLYMQAFRAPKPWDYTWGSGNSKLKPEHMSGIEMIGSYQLSESLLADISIYRNRIRDIFTKSQNRWVNNDELNVSGTELNIEYVRRNLRCFFNLTYLDATFADGTTVPEIAPFSMNSGLTYTLSQKVMWHISAGYLAARSSSPIIAATGDDQVDAYLLWNSTLTWHVSQFMCVQLVARNLLNAEYYHTSNRPVERYRQPQRTALVRFGLKWGPLD